MAHPPEGKDAVGVHQGARVRVGAEVFVAAGILVLVGIVVDVGAAIVSFAIAVLTAWVLTAFSVDWISTVGGTVVGVGVAWAQQDAEVFQPDAYLFNFYLRLSA